ALKDSELQQNPLFIWIWAEATDWWQQSGSPVSPLSSPDQAIALWAYTMKDLYKDFNKAVRKAGSSRQEYQDKFHYKSLHFLLTQALAKLRVTQGQQCHDVFRGLSGVRFQAKPGDFVRLGQFALTSLSEEVAQSFGTDTMFQVHTCHGADIHKLFKNASEKVVLVPPFETFKVTDVTQDGARIQLRSTGTHSNYNCQWLRGDVTEGTTWGEK
ncbi:NARE ribosyltransferase, partial [Vireo altiloquus]|nr:NARE ribosyltransferase [Vireo altiloquus]